MHKGDQRRAQLRFHGSHPLDEPPQPQTSIAYELYGWSIALR